MCEKDFSSSSPGESFGQVLCRGPLFFFSFSTFNTNLMRYSFFSCPKEGTKKNESDRRERGEMSRAAKGGKKVFPLPASTTRPVDLMLYCARALRTNKRETPRKRISRKCQFGFSCAVRCVASWQGALRKVNRGPYIESLDCICKKSFQNPRKPV